MILLGECTYHAVHACVVFKRESLNFTTRGGFTLINRTRKTLVRTVPNKEIGKTGNQCWRFSPQFFQDEDFGGGFDDDDGGFDDEGRRIMRIMRIDDDGEQAL
jgi:hypothetical protein